MDVRIDPNRIPSGCIWINISGGYGAILADIMENDGFKVTRFNLVEEPSLRKYLENDKHETRQFLHTDGILP